ncbi:hypothetical protein SteCoe_12645 [Stentor coeruleus]|uniref:Uncharacterized protein n=1 Tax=Stentor coeruleus TaxID=5963 RepID=A0A1R2CAC5_9CILI|nr:hypothetical protein SteCoe_12645 [Stentor coeruleus]
MAYYHDQHLAWQQRVSKEITAASRFYNHYQQLPKFSSTPNSASAKPVNSSSFSKQFYQTTDSKLTGVYAEVRGKYARPPPLMQKSNLIQSLAPKENYLVGRPSTTGSLKPRSASIKSSMPVENKAPPQDPNPIKQRIFKYRSASSNSKNRPLDANSESPLKNRQQVRNEERPNEEQHVDIEKFENPDQQNVDEAPPVEIYEEEGKNYQNQEDYLRDGLSYVSGLTTSSQRRYIMELESLLKEEKLKRIQLEESLKKVAENNK